MSRWGQTRGSLIGAFISRFAAFGRSQAFARSHQFGYMRNKEIAKMRRTLLSRTSMERILPDPIVGAGAGFALGAFAFPSLGFLGAEVPKILMLAFAVLGTIGGCVIGALCHGAYERGRLVAWWCVAMAWTLRVAGFLVGFIGPMVLEPGSPRGPMFGIFVAGPLGAIAGAIGGICVGLLVPRSAKGDHP